MAFPSYFKGNAATTGPASVAMSTYIDEMFLAGKRSTNCAETGPVAKSPIVDTYTGYRWRGTRLQRVQLLIRTLAIGGEGLGQGTRSRDSVKGTVEGTVKEAD